ncbi:MAG: invasin domain 3-containing protein [Candidatus Verstraetearchaeota archaeon]|nr:invasin domain 3-containing protein [Candidatus Verstraetearchaeota archaeon]
MLKKSSSRLAFVLLVLICIQSVISGLAVSAAVPEPTKLKIYVGPPKVPADNNEYETIYVQLQDSKGVPARANRDIEIYLSSSSTYVGSVEPVIKIRAGETYAVAKFYSTYTPGSTTITAAASGFETVQATMTTVGPVPYKLAVYSFPEVLPADNRQYGAVVVQLQDSSGTPAKAPIGNVNVSLFSSNTTIGTVEPYVVIASGSTYAVARFNTTTLEGSTTITAIASGYVTGQTTIRTQWFSNETATKLLVCVSPPKVPADGVFYDAVAVQLQDSKGRIVNASYDISVSLSSSNTGIGKITESITIPKNQSYAIARFNSTYRSGTTTITAVATNLTVDTSTITTVGPVPSKLAIYCVPSNLPADNRQYGAVVVQLQDSSGTPAKDPEGNVKVDLFSSKPEVGFVASPLVIPYGKTYSITSFNSTFIAGSTDLTAQTAGYDSAQAKISTNLIDEIPLTIVVSAEPAMINSGENSTIRILVRYNDTVPAPGVTVKLSSNKGGTFSTITDEKNGYYSAVFTAPKVNSKTVISVTANASKTGYITKNGSVTITVEPVIQLGSLRLYIKDSDGNPVRAANVVSTSQPSGASPVASTTDQDGLASFTDIMAGTYIFNITKEGYETKNIVLAVNINQTTTYTLTLTKIQSSLFDFNVLLIAVVSIAAAAVIIVAFVFLRRRRRLPE